MKIFTINHSDFMVVTKRIQELFKSLDLDTILDFSVYGCGLIEDEILIENDSILNLVINESCLTYEDNCYLIEMAKLPKKGHWGIWCRRKKILKNGIVKNKIENVPVVCAKLINILKEASE